MRSCPRNSKITNMAALVKLQNERSPVKAAESPVCPGLVCVDSIVNVSLFSNNYLDTEWPTHGTLGTGHNELGWTQRTQSVPARSR